MTGPGGRHLPHPDVHYPGKSHESLKAMTDPADAGAVQGVADGWLQLGVQLSQAGIVLQQAVFGSEAEWTGPAADAMRRQLSQVAEWSMTSGANFTEASKAITKQAESAGEAKSAMPEPVPYDPKQMFSDAAPNPFKMAALAWEIPQQYDKHQAAHAEAAEVVARRDVSMIAAAASVPPFEPPPTLEGGGGTGDDPDAGMGDRRNHDRGSWTGDLGGSSNTGTSSGLGTGQSSSGVTGQVGPGSSTGTYPGGTSASGWVPPTTSGGQNGPYPGGPGPGTGGSNNNFGNTFLPGGGRGYGPGDPRGGGGSAGGRGGGAGSGAGHGNGPGSGGRAGAGAFGADAASRGAGAGGAGGGRGGAAGMGGGAGGGRGQGGVDEEHTRASFLQEADPDALFGTDEITAPPVIGG